MYVRELSVTDFRSWAQADLTFSPGVSVLVGANGQGKTNLVEAVGYLATLGSHRVSSDAPLVRRGAAAAQVRATVVNDGRELTVQVEIQPGKANRARVNRSPVTRARDILGIVRTVVFAPEDLALVRGDPGERRGFLDELLVARAPRWAGVRADYEKVLRQRSALLKTARHARGDTSTLEVWDAHLARAGAALTAGRIQLAAALAPHVTAAYAAVAPESVPVGARYRSKVAAVDELAGTADGQDDVTGGAAHAELAAAVEVALLEEIGRRRDQEIERGVCLVGPHRDELDLSLGEGPAKGFASHGESWALALALRLGGFELLREEGSEPILVLDDVFAELDARRRDALARTAARAEQVLVTAAVDDDVPSVLNGTRYVIEAGTVRDGVAS
ncbi:DNA replication/repair protein RecF [Actinomycetospora sp. NBRC 106378]|uniref:DNA replication/repair protein RecF n=1 Tax=Actinomycetospora sp. NBRC 106378 TaxID=3032208 RepID=UPI0024A4CB8C|nr:DNA replication/repair protein RecF [Actinomycetospora sp. NBRC 106378]GLZ54922.1 DNA replication and repair protein RecF [Actinomycetospora sp. NBRC 106378]